MLRYPPTEIVLLPSDIEISMRRIAARKRANAAPYISRQVIAASRTRLPRPPAEYDSCSDASTQTSDQKERAVSSQSASDFEERLAQMAIRDEQPGGEGRSERQTSTRAVESDQENSEEAEMAVFTDDPNTLLHLGHLRSGEAVMDDTPPRSTRFMRYLREPAHDN